MIWRTREPICAHSISLMAPMKCGVALMSLSSETESIVCPTLYQRAALRRSSFSASFAGAMALFSAYGMVLSGVCRYVVVRWRGKTRAVGEGGASSRLEFMAFLSCLPSHLTSLYSTSSRPLDESSHNLLAILFRIVSVSAPGDSNRL